jgi:hypothetical protein
VYGSVIEKVYAIGGFPLVIFILAILVILSAILSKAIEAIGNVFPYLVGLSAVLAVLGIAIYFVETNWKRKMAQRAMDRFDEFSRLLLQRYLDSKEKVDAETVDYGLGLLRKIAESEGRVASHKSLATK